MAPNNVIWKRQLYCLMFFQTFFPLVSSLLYKLRSSLGRGYKLPHPDLFLHIAKMGSFSSKQEQMTTRAYSGHGINISGNNTMCKLCILPCSFSVEIFVVGSCPEWRDPVMASWEGNILSTIPRLEELHPTSKTIITLHEIIRWSSPKPPW